ncbi:hypothetical protein ACWCQB_15665 [Streptomyces hirsutus]
MEQGGSTMGEEPAGAELLLTLFLMAAIPTVVGGAVILSLVGLTMWATAPLRRRRRAKTEGGRAPSGGARDHWAAATERLDRRGPRAAGRRGAVQRVGGVGRHADGGGDPPVGSATDRVGWSSGGRSSGEGAAANPVRVACPEPLVHRRRGYRNPLRE